MTQGIRSAIEGMTGTRVDTCPWSAFGDPLVWRVQNALPYFESGQLGFALPDPSHRLVEALTFYESVSNRMQGKQMDREREKRQRDSDAARAAQQGGRRGR